jgi:hypothetical protein
MRWTSWIVVATLAGLTSPAVAQDWKGRARLDGQVTDPQGAPLGGATVTVHSLTRAGGPVVTTDTDGRWIVDGIAAGSWTVEISAPGYDARRIGVHLPHESAWLAPVEVQLQRRPPPSPDPPAETADTPAPRPSNSRAEIGEDYRELRAALEAGRFDRAHELLATLDPEARAEADDLVEMGSLFLGAGQTADATALFDHAVERDPTHVEAHFRRALGLLALDRPGEARAGFARVLELGPDPVIGEKARLALEELPPGSDPPVP